jgi:hypothetical protein
MSCTADCLILTQNDWYSREFNSSTLRTVQQTDYFSHKMGRRADSLILTQSKLYIRQFISHTICAVRRTDLC